MSRTFLKACTLAALAAAALSCSERPKEPTARVVAPPSADITGYSTGAGYNFMVNGAQWTSGYDVPTSVGTGVIRPFLDMQASPIEDGFNTDNDNFQYDQHRTSDTNALPLNYVPVVNEMISGVSTPVREFVLDAHESDNYFKIDEFVVYLCTTDAARTYSLWTDVTGASTCHLVYDIGTANPAPPILATDQFSSGSGNTFDYRILIPNSMFVTAAGSTPLCAYDPSAEAEAACHQYILVWSKMSDVGSTFEEYSTILRPAIKVAKTPDAGTVDAGNDITFTMLVTSSGSGTATGVTLSDPLPMGSGVNWYNYTTTAGSCAITGTAPAQQTLNCTLGDLAQGSSITVTAIAHTNQTSCAVYNNTATVNSTNAGSASDPGQITVQNCRGTIIVEKITYGGYGAAFPYSTTGGLSPSSFNLTTTAAGTAGKATQTFSNVLAGSYSVTEGTLPSGWVFGTLGCTGGGANTSTTGAVATIGLDGGETITCTYTNTKTGSITIVKDAVPNNAQDFAYTATGSGVSNFSLDDDSDPTLSNTKTFTGLLAGSFTFDEGTVAGWTLTNIVCTGATGSTVTIGASGGFDAGDHLVSVNLATGENITCTYTNTKLGSITIVKDAVPNDAQDFAYTATGTGVSNFSLDDDSDVTLSNTKVFNNLLPGAFTFDEGAVTGWKLTNIVCTGATGSTVTIGASGAFDAGDHLVSVNLLNGESITCTYTNTKQAILRIAKATDPDGSPVEFTFTPTGGWNSGSTFTRHDNQAAFASDYLAPGTYGATETVPAGWALTGRTCANTAGGAHAFTTPTDGVSVTLAAGEDVTCTFTDTELATLIIQKIVTGGSTMSFTFARTGIAVTDLGDNPSPTLQDGQSSSSGKKLSPGTYKVCETNLAAGWQDPTATLDGGAITLYNPDNPQLLGNFCYNVTLTAGQTKTIAFTNAPPPGNTRTIGYWKNWSSCDGKGKQWEKSLANDAYAGTLDANLPQTIGLLVLDKDPAGPDGEAYDCSQAINILAKSSIDGTKQPGDAAYNLAAQLLGAKLNITAGSGSCTAANTAIAQAQALLVSISFNGLGSYLTSKVGDPAVKTAANALAATLDSFNNGTLGGGCPTHAP